MKNKYKKKVGKQFKIINKFVTALEKAKENADEVLTECAVEKADIAEMENECKKVKKTCDKLLKID